MAGKNIAETVRELVAPVAEDLGLLLWDVEFVKEGARRILRVTIDHEDGITIDDCERMHRAIDPVLDEADPIDKAYFLEVCSCGIERELTKPWHFEAVKGQKVKVRLYKAIDGKKEFSGILTEVGETVVISTENGDLNFQKADISKAYLDDFEN